MNPLPLLAALLGLPQRGVIDQIDEGIASVEWHPSGEYGFVPLDQLPAGAREGQAVALRLRRSRSPDPRLELPRALKHRGWEAASFQPKASRRTSS